MKKRLAVLIPLTVVMAGFAVGCGSSSDDSSSDSGTALTKAEYVKQADKICSDGSAALTKAVADATKSGDASATDPTKFTQDVLIPNLQGQVDDLRALSPPAGDEETTAKIYDSLQSGIDSVNEDPKNLNGAFNEASQLAGDYGMPACAAS